MKIVLKNLKRILFPNMDPSASNFRISQLLVLEAYSKSRAAFNAFFIFGRPPEGTKST